MDVKILLVTFLGIFKPSILNTDVIYFKQVARFQNAKTFLLASSILTLKARQSLSKDEFWISSSRTPCCQPDYFHFFYFCSLWIFTPSLNYFLQLQCIFTNKTKKFLTTKGKTSKHTEYNAGWVCLSGIQYLVSFSLSWNIKKYLALIFFTPFELMDRILFAPKQPVNFSTHQTYFPTNSDPSSFYF